MYSSLQFCDLSCHVNWRGISCEYLVIDSARVNATINTWRQIYLEAKAARNLSLMEEYSFVDCIEDIRASHLSLTDRRHLQYNLLRPEFYQGSVFDLCNFEELFRIRFIIINTEGEVTFLPSTRHDEPRLFILLYYRDLEGEDPYYQPLAWTKDGTGDRKVSFSKDELPPEIIEMSKGKSFSILPLAQEMT